MTCHACLPRLWEIDTVLSQQKYNVTVMSAGCGKSTFLCTHGDLTSYIIRILPRLWPNNVQRHRDKFWNNLITFLSSVSVMGRKR